MICKNCGNLIPDSSPFCPICGRRDPDTYSIKNPYAPPSPFSSPAPPPQQVYGLPLQQQPGVSPRTGSQLPDPNIYYPVPLVAKRHTKSLVLAITIPIIILLLVFSIFISSLFRSTPTATTNQFEKGTEYNPYSTGEMVVVTGDHYDSQLNPCVCTSEVVLQEFVTGDMAGKYMESLGADLSLLDSGEEYAIARFQVKVLSNDTPNSVYFGSSDFFFYDNHSQEFMDFYSYDFNISPESIKLGVGETGEVILFAVVPQNADLEMLYYTQDSYICFAPEGEI